MNKQQVELLKSADEFLRNHGYTTDGRPQQEVVSRQQSFERHGLVMSPVGGARKNFGSRILRGGRN